ncbi:MAG TPA: DUF3761 domain-containing protein [Terracidiphilus sp.]|nr:DUF3761 domain-containing protein [Terracidiphilus sp.]
MRLGVLKAIAMGLILIPCSAVAQAPAGAPAGATGKCKDGTYTTASMKMGACGSHKGVATWWGKAKASAKTETAAPKAAAPAASTAPAKKGSTAAGTPAPGGGPGLVWVNTSTKVYHCYGTRYYGTTKSGKYMTEAAAKGAGAHAENGKGCSK